MPILKEKKKFLEGYMFLNLPKKEKALLKEQCLSLRVLNKELKTSNQL